MNRITQFTSADGTTDFEYDKTDQLTDATHSYQTDESYSYDANGNRTNTGYTTGSDNRLTNDGTYSYEYDDEGNRTKRTHDTTCEETVYEWDFRNRLTSVTEKDSLGSTTQVVEYTYDVFDRRIGKAVDTTSPFNMANAAIERYVIDDVNGVASVDGGNVVLDFVDPDGDGASTIALERRQLFGNAVDQILATEDVTESTSSADRVYWPLVDHLGTVRDLVENDGTLGEHYTYDTFGNVTSGDTSLIRYLYTSRELDTATGLQYNRARWYDAEVGRWISMDPIGFAAGDANLYRYVNNEGFTYTDPSGLETKWSPQGHHWIPWGEVKNRLKYLTDGAVNIAIAYTSGPLDHSHNWHTPYGGVSHQDYNKYVGEEFDKFIEIKKKQGKRYLNADDMLEFAELIKDGKQANGLKHPQISAFNDAIKQHRENYLAGGDGRGFKKPRNKQNLLKTGRELRSHSRFKQWLAGAGAIVFIGGQLQQLQAAQEVLQSNELQLGMNALAQGDLDGADRHFVGRNQGGMGGFTAVLMDQYGHGGIAFSRHYTTAIGELLNESHGVIHNLNNLPVDPADTINTDSSNGPATNEGTGSGWQGFPEGHPLFDLLNLGIGIASELGAFD